MKLQLSSLLVLILLGIAIAQLVDVEPQASEKSDIILDWQYPYHYTAPYTHLLTHENASTTDEVKLKKIQTIKSRIRVLLQKLVQEEEKLHKLQDAERNLKSADFFWLFNETIRERVDQAKLNVNDQQRVVENIADDVMVEAKRLKPLFGPFSKMFFVEAFGFIPQMLDVLFEFVTTMLELGLISLLLFGSFTGFIFSMTATLGFAFFPIVICFTTLAISTYWLFKLPLILISYSPTIPEFIALYGGFVGILVAITFLTFRLFFPEIVKTRMAGN